MCIRDRDEDIIALSNPPYYTACPNPFIEDFIKEHGKPYDEATDDYPVSYTHLDVYKRQGHAVIALRNGTTLTASDLETLPKISAIDIYEFKYIFKPKDMQLAEPVSYTHLDVYKRQVHVETVVLMSRL